MLNLASYIFRIAFCLLLLAPSSALCQASVAEDSLLHIFSKAPSRSIEKAQAIKSLTDYYRNRAPLESIRYAEELIQLANELDSDEYRYLGYMALGVGYAMLGTSMDKAVENFLSSLEIAQSHTEEEWQLRQIKANMNIAGVHWMNKDIPTAFRYTYAYTGQLETSNDRTTLGAAYETLALMHEISEQWDSVFHYIDKAKTIYDAIGPSQRALEIKRLEAVAYSHTNRTEKALSVFDDLISQAALKGDTMVLINSYVDLAELYLGIGLIPQAKKMANEGLMLSERLSLTPSVAAYNQMLYEIFSTLEQPDSALLYYKAYSEAREKTINEEKVNAIEEMETRYHLKERMEENEQLKEVVRTKNFLNLVLALSSFLFLLLIIAIIFFYIRLRKRKSELEGLNLKIVNINAQLRSLMNEKRHMVSLIAHDIRTPLSIIQLNTYALDGEALVQEERSELLQEIESAASAIDEASLKIMEIENKSDQSLAPQNKAFDAVPLLIETKRRFLAYAKSKNIQLTFDLPDMQVLMKGDPFLFRHILANFLSNAIKYAPFDSEVQVSLQQTAGQLSIKIADQGPGLKKEDYERIFLQGTTTANEPTAGERKLGEGLYLTKRYVEAMDGIIKVESQPGEGTVFTIVFPKVA